MPIMDARLVVSRGKTNVQEVRLKGRTLVGRVSECDLRVLSQAVSRKHCEIFERDDKLVVRDLGSTNGTAVNGTLVDEQVLEPGDLLTIGPLEFTVIYQPPTEIESEKTRAAGVQTEELPDLDFLAGESLNSLDD